MLRVRKTTESDLKQIDIIFDVARLTMRENGNSSQWNGVYPNSDDVVLDIKNNCSYVVVDASNDVVGTFAFIVGEEPTYNEIFDGNWLNNNKYGTIHRIASNQKYKGVFKTVLEFCFNKEIDIRIDTHEDNKIMRHLLESNGFKYCGIIYVHDHSKRLAYQLCKKS